MKILVLATDAYGGHGGIAQLTRDFCSVLDGHELTVIPRLVRSEVRGVPPHVTFVERAARNPVEYLRAVAAARRTPYDLVVCNHINLLRVAFHRPLLMVHGIEVWKRRRAPLDRCGGIIAVSSVTRDRLVGWSGYAGPTFVLPAAIRAGDYGIRPRRRELVERYGLEGKRVLLTVGRLDAAERYKGFDEVLELLPSLPEDVVYIIAGGGNDAVRLQHKARNLGIGNRVVFTGLFPESEKADLYNLADVYVMPSRGEGFGFVFLEALACGVPAIGSKVDGGREALRNGELGLLVDPSNREEIRAATLETLAHGKRRIPEGLEYFSMERLRERAAAILASLVPSPRTAGRGSG